MNGQPYTYRCVIVDDNEIDRLTTHSNCLKYDFLNVVATFSNPEEAIVYVKNNPVDILFLDIDMPEMTGLDLRKQLLQNPICIFVTSHPEFALEGFELSALDFLVKPFKAERFADTASRIKQYMEIINKATLLDHTVGIDTLFIKDGHEQYKIQLQDIFYLEALKDYTGIITHKKKYCVLASLGQLLKEMPFKNFIRIHRSYAVQKHYVTKVTPREVFVNNTALPIGRSYKEQLNF